MTKPFRFFSSFVFALGMLLLATPALQSQIRTSTAQELTRESDIVVVGTVGALTPEWNEGKTRIQTRVTLSVNQYVKGEGGASFVTIVVPGGEIDGVGEIYSHSPRFVHDEQVLVFARKDLQGRFRVAGGEMGKLVVQKDDRTGKLYVEGNRPLDELTSVIKQASQLQQIK